MNYVFKEKVQESRKFKDLEPGDIFTFNPLGKIYMKINLINMYVDIGTGQLYDVTTYSDVGVNVMVFDVNYNPLEII